MLTRIAAILPVVALFFLIGINSHEKSAADTFALDAKVGLNAYAALVDQEIESARNGLRILASTENARSGDWERIKGPLTLFAGATPANATVWFARPDASYFTVETGLSNQSLRDRDYFPVLMAGKEVAGDLVVSKSTGKRSDIIAVPVLKDGRVIGALGVSMAMEKVADLVEDRMAFPNEVMFYALGPSGQTALHRQSSLLFEYPAKVGSPTLAAAVREMLAKPEGTVHYEFQGAQRTTIFKRSNATGWIYALRW